MPYRERIQQLMQQVPVTLVDLSVPREPARIPSQASSEFTTNREQGDWAEKILQTAINGAAPNYIAVRYGKSEDRVAGEDGFAQFYQEFQDELDLIGKRPDLLIFKKEDFPEGWQLDISRRPHTELDAVVGRAVAGLEVRSSAFLSQKYDAAIAGRIRRCTQTVLRIKEEINQRYRELLLSHPTRSQYVAVLDGITPETVGIIDFKKPSWKGSPELAEAAALFGEMKEALKELKKRNFLSITPKVEDLKVVYAWTQHYGVPHYYVQVFFDRAYAISFESILIIIANPDNEDVLFFTESDVKNQNKTTIKINPAEGSVLAGKVDEPRHESRRKELDRGRLLYYVAFSDGAAYLDLASLAHILGVAPENL